MQVIEEYSHRYGLAALKEKRLNEEVRALVNVPAIGVARGSARRINDVVKKRLSDAGWGARSTCSCQFQARH